MSDNGENVTGQDNGAGRGSGLRPDRQGRSPSKIPARRRAAYACLDCGIPLDEKRLCYACHDWRTGHRNVTDEPKLLFDFVAAIVERAKLDRNHARCGLDRRCRDGGTPSYGHDCETCPWQICYHDERDRRGRCRLCSFNMFPNRVPNKPPYRVFMDRGVRPTRIGECAEDYIDWLESAREADVGEIALRVLAA